ncbi:MAG: FAD-dependent oxidoreductase, partial [Pseudonocardia sp.]|nr:FAD-dependent oxidoreductase [Pseudonocardia sp.]
PTELSFDRLVLASGSQLIRPDLPGAEHLHNVDTLPAAAALQAHLRQLPRRPEGPGRFTAVVVGAGFTGLEVATELVERLRSVAESVGAADAVRVVLVEREDVVGIELGAGPRPDIERALAELGVEKRLGVGVAGVGPDGVTLSDGDELPAATVVWTAGVLASPLTAKIPAARDRLGRLEVDEYLRVVGVPEVYAAGDTAAAVAEEGHHVMQSCQHAGPQGRFAGHNVAADLLGLPPHRFEPDPYVTCLDLGAAGAVFTKGWDRTVELTEAEAKQRKRQVNEVWIYPPVDDAEEILRRADYRVSTRQPYAPLST